jgi:hypothetical protein
MKDALPGLIERGPYLARKIPDHPLASKQGYVLEHRRVIWESRGPFDSRLHVHHINHDTRDNRLANLQLLTTAEHARQHGDDQRNYYFDTIIAEYNAGMSTTQLSVKYGLSQAAFSRILRRLGVQMRPRGGADRRGTKMPDEQRKALAHPLAPQLVDAYLGGSSIEEVAERFDVNPSTVIRSVRRAGHASRPRGRPPVERRWSRDEMSELFDAAGSISQLARDLGFSRMFARQLLREYELI